MFVGQQAVVRCPPDAPGETNLDGSLPETWMQGRIHETLARHERGFMLHVIEVTGFKWAWADPWGAYDGVPFALAREIPGTAILQWVDTWPRRR